MADYSFEDSGKQRNVNIAGKLLTAALLILLGLVVWNFLSKKQAPGQEGRIVLNMWDIPRSNLTRADARAAYAVHAAFIKAHPEIHFIRTRGIMVGGPASESAFFTAMAGGTAPDLWRMNMRRSGSHIEQGFLRPLDDFVAEWFAEDPSAQAKIYDAVRPGICRTVMEDGKQVTHIYAIPTGYDLMGIYYRKSLFQDAGLPVDGCPPDQWNWQMLWEYSKKMTFPEDGHFGLMLPTGMLAGWMWMNYVWQADGEIVKQFGIHPTTGEYIPLPPPGAPDSAWTTADGVDLRTVPTAWRVVYDEKPGVEALEFYKKLRWAPWTRCQSAQCRGKNVCYDVTDDMKKAGAARCPQCGGEVPIAPLEANNRLYRGVLFLNATYEENDPPFFQEKRIGMMMYAAGDIFVAATNMNPDEIGLMPLPAGPRGTRANALNTGPWGISSQLKDPQKIRAAWEYIKWQASDQAEEISVRTMVEAGWGCYVDPAKLSKYGFDEYVKHVPKTWASTYEQLKLYGKVEPYAPNFASVQTAELAIPLDAVLTDENADPAALLKASAQKVNNTIFQEIPASVMNRRRKIAYTVAGIAVVLLGLLAVSLARGVKDLVRAAASRKAMGLKFAQTSLFAAWAFMIPAVLTIFVWDYIPLARGATMAFMDYRILGNSKWVGLDNFVRLFADPVFYQSLLITVYYVVLAIAFQFTAPIVLGLLLAEVPRGKIIYRIIYYLPAVTSGLVIMFLWKKFYDPSNGLFNYILGFLGLPGSDWLASGKWWLPMLCIVLPMVWAGAGPGALIYLAALKSVPEEIYEAGDIDGASTWQKVTNITLPYLKPLIIINFVGAFIGAFQAMQQVFVMTGGGPARKTNVIGLEIWSNAYLYLRFGYATAEAWVLGLMLIGFTVYQLQILKKVRFTTAKV